MHGFWWGWIFLSESGFSSRDQRYWCAHPSPVDGFSALVNLFGLFPSPNFVSSLIISYGLFLCDGSFLFRWEGWSFWLWSGKVFCSVFLSVGLRSRLRFGLVVRYPFFGALASVQARSWCEAFWRFFRELKIWYGLSSSIFQLVFLNSSPLWLGLFSLYFVWSLTVMWLGRVRVKLLFWSFVCLAPCRVGFVYPRSPVM